MCLLLFEVINRLLIASGHVISQNTLQAQSNHLLAQVCLTACTLVSWLAGCRHDPAEDSHSGVQRRVDSGQVCWLEIALANLELATTFTHLACS